MSSQQYERPRSAQPPVYRERLWVPVGWWGLAALFALSLLVAVLFYLGPIAGLLVGVGVMLLIGAGLIGYGREEIEVGAERLLAAGANLEWRYVASVQALDPAETRRRRGRDADARAYLVLRPYLQRAVEVSLDDPQDPTPYWLINTRHPKRLAAAIEEQITGGSDAGHRPNTSPPATAGPDSPRDTLKS